MIYPFTTISYPAHDVPHSLARKSEKFFLLCSSGSLPLKIFPFTLLLFRVAFSREGLLYKFCRWPQESPSSNPNPKPLYRSWPSLQNPFKHLPPHLARLLMNVSAKHFHFDFWKLAEYNVDTASTSFMHGDAQGDPCQGLGSIFPKNNIHISVKTNPYRCRCRC